MDKQKEKWLIGGGAVLAIGAVFVASHTGGAGQTGPSHALPKGGTPKPQMTPNPANAAIAQAYIAAKAGTVQSYNAGVSTNAQTAAAQRVGLAQIRGQTQIATIESSTQEAITAAETAAEESVASTQAGAEENVAQTQQPQWWESLLGGLGSGIGGFLGGFNRPSYGYAPGGAPSGGGLLALLQQWIPQLNPTSYGPDVNVDYNPDTGEEENDVPLAEPYYG